MHVELLHVVGVMSADTGFIGKGSLIMMVSLINCGVVNC